MRKLLLALSLCLSTLAMSAHGDGDGDVDQLIQALSGVTHLQGNFTQRQYAPDGEILQTSSGHFRLLRPGYFSWNIQQPDKQLIIADPHYIWHQDLDLETVTRRPVSSGGEMTPLQILGGDEAVLRNSFKVVNKGGGEFTLTPLSDTVGFKELTLRLAQPLISGMDILDKLDQRVVIEFTDMDSETRLSSADFDFIPPPGADLFYYDQ